MLQSRLKPVTAFAAKPSPLVAFVTVIVIGVVGFYSLHFPFRSAASLDASRFDHVFLSSSSNATISSYLRALTVHPHLAGTKPASLTARYVLNHFTGLGFRTTTARYRPLLSYPLRSSLSAHFSDGSSLEFRLGEGEGNGEVVAPYHAYSPSGSAWAAAVFVNYGREEDFRLLAAAGVGVAGCVAVARSGGGVGRGAVVEAAERHGAAAVVVFGDGDTWPRGFERGHVMRGGIGDPLSPGWGGVDGGESLGLDDNEVLRRFPKIPSMPLSSEAAERILASLGGAPLPLDWRGTLKSSKVRNVGPGPTILNFTYQGEMKVATIENVFAIIKGREESDRYVLLGNHRDAWTYGAVDPNSGTAALLDIARRYAILLRLGWTPRRTIILCSWDAEEFGMIGSTEWVEQNLVNLRSKAVAYLNVDCAVQGPSFFAGSTPQLDDLLLDIIKKVKDPDSDEGTTIYQNWAAGGGKSNIQRLGRVDSDFAPFVQHAGVPSIDMYYGKDYPVYHTAFDSYNWMTEFGDPFFQRHVAVTGIWGLLALRLADDSIIPFNYVSYADQLQVYNDKLSNLLDKQISLHPLTASIQEFASAAKEANEESEKLRLQENSDHFVNMKIRALNDRLMLAEKGFLDVDGLRGRQWFKHLVFGPPRDQESKLDFFPGIADSMSEMFKMSEKERLAAIQHELWRVARAIQRAASALRGDLA
ncbi:probable glutamate carboxypeptidase AMP1 [Vigna unguiculata]|uniref:probable glutamate carboxypeptidase AMP1 n=1 Tax=Vigna unguiculata TaxID=3917 RepID=UPI001016AE72|nr:probable glutamate carboxypeptidase AMP1 [Vigna unguiculata]